MKVVAFLSKPIGTGGGFDQALNGVLQMQRLCHGRHDFEVVTSEADNLPLLAGLGVNALHASPSPGDRLLDRLSTSALWHALQRRLRWVARFERTLIARGCDLVYFVTPDARSASLQRLNFITTVWDLCHRDHPEFPEVREFNESAVRERYYRHYLGAATLVLCDSTALADALARRYGIDPQRALAMPFAPSPFLGRSPRSMPDVLAQHGLEQGYFFYPAQFWAHKNHVRIVQALAILRQRGAAPHVVFCGRDCGTLSHVETHAAACGVRAQVHFLGFVPPEQMRGLYEGALAVLMPTYFGPTNLPPLEAWTVGKPLVYSAHLADQAGDASLLAPADDAAAWADAMQACEDPALRERLVEAGRRRLAAIDGQRRAAEDALLAHLDAFAAKRACWGP